MVITSRLTEWISTRFFLRIPLFPFFPASTDRSRTLAYRPIVTYFPD